MSTNISDLLQALDVEIDSDLEVHPFLELAKLDADQSTSWTFAEELQSINAIQLDQLTQSVNEKLSSLLQSQVYCLHERDDEVEDSQQSAHLSFLRGLSSLIAASIAAVVANPRCSWPVLCCDASH